jgi:hypothetical protein
LVRTVRKNDSGSQREAPRLWTLNTPRTGNLWPTTTQRPPLCCRIGIGSAGWWCGYIIHPGSRWALCGWLPRTTTVEDVVQPDLPTQHHRWKTAPTNKLRHKPTTQFGLGEGKRGPRSNPAPFDRAHIRSLLGVLPTGPGGGRTQPWARVQANRRCVLLVIKNLPCSLCFGLMDTGSGYDG